VRRCGEKGPDDEEDVASVHDRVAAEDFREGSNKKRPGGFAEFPDGDEERGGGGGGGVAVEVGDDAGGDGDDANAGEGSVGVD
tara:strand:- start:18491 stop:18739 length:249 start_codon:yes stop_codon:yes gene_type:complete